jgi:hypothetical protein
LIQIPSAKRAEPAPPCAARARDRLAAQPRHWIAGPTRGRTSEAGGRVDRRERAPPVAAIEREPAVGLHLAGGKAFHQGRQKALLAQAARGKPGLRQATAARARSMSLTPPPRPARAETEAATRKPSRVSASRPLTRSQAASSAVWSYISPVQNAGSATIWARSPASAPRISMYFFTRASGKTVVRWSAQSDSVGFSPGRAGSRPCRKSRNDWPSALMYFPSR